MDYPDMIQALVGLGLLALGGGLGFLLNYLLKRGVLPQVEREAEDRVRQQLAEEERTVRLSLIEERDDWYKTKARQEAELEDQLADLNRRDKSLAQLVRDLNSEKEEQSRAWNRLKNQERRIGQRERGLKGEEQELGQMRTEYQQRLELASGLPADEAREQMMGASGQRGPRTGGGHDPQRAHQSEGRVRPRSKKNHRPSHSALCG